MSDIFEHEVYKSDRVRCEPKLLFKSQLPMITKY